MIGAELTAKSASDGYTLLLPTQGILTVNPALAKVRFDTLKDFAPITLVANLTSVMVVNPSLQVKTVKELIALAKARPGELTYGTPGNGSASHLAMEMFNRAAQVNIRHIPYKGAAPAVVDLIGGNLQVMLIGVPVVMPHVMSGRLVALGVASAGPSPMAQGMITIAALPFALLMVLVMVSLYRVLDQEYTRERRQAQRQRHMIDAWIAREMAAQEETQAEAARAHDQD